MKKFIVLFMVLCMATPSYAGLFSRKDKALENELQGRGCAGTLPDLQDKLEPVKKKTATPIFEAQEGFDNPEDLKPVPEDNPAFIDIIKKKDKTSNFVKDAYEIIPMIEKVIDSIDDEDNVQLFISKSNCLIMNVDYLDVKYKSAPESYYESFRKLIEVTQALKSIVLLRQEAVTYQKYLAYQTSGSIYNPENINKQLELLREELKTSVLLLREET